MVQRRNIPLAVLFTVVTLGIYGVYWFICMVNDVNELSSRPRTAVGWKAAVFSAITLGLYYVYWLCRTGQKVDEIVSDGYGANGVLYLLLTFCFLGFLCPLLIQSAINGSVPAINDVPQTI